MILEVAGSISFRLQRSGTAERDFRAGGKAFDQAADFEPAAGVVCAACGGCRVVMIQSSCENFPQERGVVAHERAAEGGGSDQGDEIVIDLHDGQGR